MVKIEVDPDLIKEHDHSKNPLSENSSPSITPLTISAPKRFNINHHKITGKNLNFDLQSHPNSDRDSTHG